MRNYFVSFGLVCNRPIWKQISKGKLIWGKEKLKPIILIGKYIKWEYLSIKKILFEIDLKMYMIYVNSITTYRKNRN